MTYDVPPVPLRWWESVRLDLWNPGRTRSSASTAVTLGTRDMAASVAFYEALGFRLLYGGAEARFTSFQAGTGFLNLQLDPNVAPGRWGRVVFWVDDVDAMYQRAVSAGFATATSPSGRDLGRALLPHPRLRRPRVELRSSAGGMTYAATAPTTAADGAEAAPYGGYTGADAATLVLGRL